jgi:tRNA A-37 threonylcarbamoyl transferase component Bud32
VNGSDPTAGVPPSAEPSSVRWQIAPGWRERLLGESGLRLGEWLGSGRAQVVKHGAHRTVYRVDLPGRTIFLKHYRCSDLMALARHLLRASASRREYHKAVELARRQVPTIRPLAWGEAHWGGLVGDNYLVTEGIPHSVSLKTYATEFLPQMPAAESRPLRRKLIEELARLCAAAHQAGVFHDDFHAGNVLVRLDTCHPLDERRPELFLVDLPGIRFSGPLGWARSRNSLVMLNSDWGRQASGVERWRFWRSYLRHRTDLRVIDPHEALRDLARRTRDYACRLQRGRARRSLRTNRDFYALQTPTGRGHAVTQVAPADLVRLLEEPERLLRAGGVRRNVDTGSVAVKAEFPVAGELIPIAYRRWAAGPWQKLLAAVAPSPARNAWYLGHTLLDRGIPTPRPLAVCTPSSWRSGAAGFLATEWIDGAMDLRTYVSQLSARPPAERSRRTRQAIDSLADVVGRLHAWRLAHVDLRLSAFLVVEDEQGVRLWLRDVSGVRIRRRLSYGEQVRNLLRLADQPGIGRTTAWRFLRAYVRALQPADVDPRRLWQLLVRNRG